MLRPSVNCDRTDDTATRVLQVDGCCKSLTREKAYFRRYRCCMAHSKQESVLVDNEVKRWCQQCCCFHDLNLFDGARR